MEIGCGNGYLLNSKPSRAVGVDFSPVMIKYAKRAKSLILNFM
ncbi:MAG: class I SAM-dependent methyltransferase [Ignavibacteria bacterium]|nr:class I SAM-dependent methyltransferase [Ignavibacteria bacterium]